MPPDTQPQSSLDLPDGFMAVPVFAPAEHATLRLCVLLSNKPQESTGSQLVVLRETLDARVLLGCVIDASSRVHQWIELWIQNVDQVADSPAALRKNLSNRLLDERWAEMAQALLAIDGRVVIHTGFEAQHCPPILIDLATGKPWQPMHASGHPWMLCTDERFLAHKLLPSYASSLYRYLWVPALGDRSPVVAATHGAPVNDQVQQDADIAGGKTNLALLNPTGGLLLVRGHSSLRFDSFVDLLGGATPQLPAHGRSILRLDPFVQVVTGGDATVSRDDAWLFIGPQGEWGRLLEAFHLKLRLLADAVNAVATLVQKTQRPMLNLDAESFAVRGGEVGVALPALWTARAVLQHPGESVQLQIPSADLRYYLSGSLSGMSIYRQAAVSSTATGRATVRIRGEIAAGDATILEGTFATQESLHIGRNDLVWLRLPVGNARIDLYAHLEEEKALSAGEWRLRTVGQKLDASLRETLKSVPEFQQAAYEVMPLLSTPCDLYSLAVLAVRTLLVNPTSTLQIAMDEITSLAREAARQHDPSAPLPLRIRAICESDPRWLASLGPQRLVQRALSAKDVFDVVLPELWWEVLAMIVRALPAIGPDSTCKDLGDAQPGGLHKVFDRLQQDLKLLLIRSRSLIVIDWRYNREIHAVIRSELSGITAPPPRSGTAPDAKRAVPRPSRI